MHIHKNSMYVYKIDKEFFALLSLQIFGYLVAPKMSNNKKTRKNNDHHHLVGRINYDDSLGDILRPRWNLQRCTRRKTLPRSVARFYEWRSIFFNRKYDFLLHITDDSDNDVLRTDMDQGVETQHSHRHQRCSDGTTAAEIKSKSGENASRRSDIVRPLLASALRNIC